MTGIKHFANGRLIGGSDEFEVPTLSKHGRSFCVLEVVQTDVSKAATNLMDENLVMLDSCMTFVSREAVDSHKMTTSLCEAEYKGLTSAVAIHQFRNLPISNRQIVYTTQEKGWLVCSYAGYSRPLVIPVNTSRSRYNSVYFAMIMSTPPLDFNSLIIATMFPLFNVKLLPKSLALDDQLIRNSFGLLANKWLLNIRWISSSKVLKLSLTATTRGPRRLLHMTIMEKVSSMYSSCV